MIKMIKDEQGTAGVEYALFLSLVAMVIFGVLQSLGMGLKHNFSFIDGMLNSGQMMVDAHRKQ